ncbi:MAG: U32 family peptidase, partial [Myxococcales bacterium]|nr:U32 family peptidase [Myxococcales bacterium]
MRAAVGAGADAVYFGLQRFNARARATNFAVDELGDVMSYLHLHGVKGFVTLNTLVFDEELDDALDLINCMCEAGVDAVIVQDLGIIELIRQVSTELPIHASTQATVTSTEGVEWLAKLGAERVVLARELSIDDIKEIGEGTATELEVFVHGALCVSYSGQCFSSEAWGGRSANRGQCAQACRLPYDLIVDGLDAPAGDLQLNLKDEKYLLSPQDLMALDQVPQLIDAGVSCFKIEGRLKGPEYVALATSAYRQAIDRVVAGNRDPLSAEVKGDLEQIFSRGMTPGFLEGPQHQVLVEGRVPRHRGRLIGTVTAVHGAKVRVALSGPVKAGDGLVFEPGALEGGNGVGDIGGRVYHVFVEGRRVDSVERTGEAALEFANDVPVGRLQPGMTVWKTRDEALEGRVRRDIQAARRRVPVTAEVFGRLGQPLELTLSDEEGHSFHVVGQVPLQHAQRSPLDDA